MSSATFTTSNLPRFRALVDEWESKQPLPTSFVLPNTSTPDTGVGRESKDVIVAFRTRPPLDGEAEAKFEADPNMVVKGTKDTQEASSTEGEQVKVDFCPGISVRSAEPGVMVAHVPGMKWNGPTITHKSFDADLAFGPNVGNEEVYARTIGATDMLNLVLGGGVGCVLAYGQTGAGKTYTMEALEKSIARDIFGVAEQLSARFLASHGTSDEPATNPKNVFELSVSFLELLGKRASDLVDEPESVDEEGNQVRKEVAVHENKLGEVRPRLIHTVVNSSEELDNLLVSSLEHRRTSATRRNAASSRSHAILTIRAKNTLLPYGDEGLLILVDLAGSERYEDSKAHSKQRMDESRENNKALMNLKDCVRAKAKAVVQEEGFVHIPFRASKLTLLLKPIFDLESRQMSKTIVIAHVSPHLQDTAHSVSTLQYAAPFKTTIPKRSTKPLVYDATDPRTWDNAQTVEWLSKQFDNHPRVLINRREWEAKNSTPFPPLVDFVKLLPPPKSAKNLSRIYANEWVEACLQAQNIGPDTKQNKRQIDEFKQIVLTVYGKFNYLLLTARLRTRKEIMKTRKVLTEDNTYGDAPEHDWKNIDEEGWIARLDSYSDTDLMLITMLHGDEIKARREVLTKQSQEGDTAWRVGYARGLVEVMEKYRDEVEKSKAEGMEHSGNRD